MTDPKNIINDLIHVTGQLNALLAQENDILKARRLGEIQGLQKEKSALGSAYENLMRDLISDRDRLAKIAPALRAELTEKTHAFNELAQENGRRIRAAQEINDNIIQIIANAATKEQRDTNLYSRKGKVTQPEDGKVVSMSVNETL
ncbi:MAG: flagellar export chaperone FlgN [Alphaproteobacteria bacterium]|nr:flagellar export chaperone FlgN [Alphaproteobacteria bacterium]